MEDLACRISPKTANRVNSIAKYFALDSGRAIRMILDEVLNGPFSKYLVSEMLDYLMYLLDNEPQCAFSEELFSELFKRACDKYSADLRESA